MSKMSKTLSWLIPLLVVFIAGFLVAAFWDLQIDEALYDPTNLFAILMEALAWYPAYLPIVLLGGLMAMRPAGPNQPPWRRPIGGIVALLCLAVFYYMSYHYLEKRGLVTGPGDYRTWVWLAVGLLAAGFAVYGLYRLYHCPPALGRKLTLFALFGCIFMAANQIATQGVKLVWQRTRFDDMLAAGSLEDFTPWFQPFGNGGASFPSAHTANAAGIFALIILCDIFPAFNRRRKLIYGICWVYIAAMAFARILIGRHFLSDTLAGAGIVALLFWGLRSTPFYKKEIASIRGKNT